MLAVILLVLLCGAAEVKALCTSMTVTATTGLRSVTYGPYSNNEDCTITFRPNAAYIKGYYLEFTWRNFDIEGNMPHCFDYIQVKLTKQQRSIGMYCSDNTGSSKLFNMYSIDGHASIRFKSDSSVTRGGFIFTFQLKSNRNNTIGQIGTTRCGHSADTSHHGIFYTSGWPTNYRNEDAYCYLRFGLRRGNAIRLVVMDLDLRQGNHSCNGGSDYFQIRESSTQYDNISSVLKYTHSSTKRYCRDQQPMVFTVQNSYVYTIIDTHFASNSSSHRGVLMGYIIYDDRQPPTTMRTQNFTKNWLPNSAAARNVNIWIGIALLLAIPLFMGTA